ncbi:HAD hydrolase family protein [Raineyella fluvialis]|uniref:HAD hydrolase family protein n=1 Tax=Raineyella fluvialis TaxID=2662261 RepID=A0A5Q2FC86_9ACTN|nr:HAD hydrolase family protein [Raineyella fluvialis]QGF24378.1 HAD hydrolase family protein [Raineyella fluvialis]
MIPRLIATDLDGTFLHPDGVVSQTNARAVRAALDEGVHVVFATGRPPTWMQPIADLGLPTAPVIGCNGAIRYDLATGEVAEVVDIDPALIATLGQRVREVLPGVTLGLQRGDSFGYEPGYLESPPTVPGYRCAPLEDLLVGGPVLKVLVQSYRAPLDDVLTALREVAGEELTLTWSTRGADTGERVLVEVGARGVDKAAMLARYCATLGLDAGDVAAFGDMPNDLEMLSWAGRAYVMPPRHPLLAGIGRAVERSCSEDGVGRTILEWFNGVRGSTLTGVMDQASLD